MDFVAYTDPSSPRINAWRTAIAKHAAANNVPSCALAAIVTRESGGDANARSSDGGFGLCQITSGVNAHGIYTATGQSMLDPDANLAVAARDFLAPALAQCVALRERHQATCDSVSPDILYFAFAAFNAGFGTVENAIVSGHDPDQYTTGRYAAGTLALYAAAVRASHAAAPVAEPVHATGPVHAAASASTATAAPVTAAPVTAATTPASAPSPFHNILVALGIQ